MGDWTTSSSDSDHETVNVNPAEKKRKSLKLNRKEVDRWDFIGEEHKNNLSRKYISKNTAATKRALSNFNMWMQGRNKQFAGDSGKCIPDDILETTDSAVLFLLTNFRTTSVISTRRLSSTTSKHC